MFLRKEIKRRFINKLNVTSAIHEQTVLKASYDVDLWMSIEMIDMPTSLQ